MDINDNETTESWHENMIYRVIPHLLDVVLYAHIANHTWNSPTNWKTFRFFMNSLLVFTGNLFQVHIFSQRCIVCKPLQMTISACTKMRVKCPSFMITQFFFLFVSLSISHSLSISTKLNIYMVNTDVYGTLRNQTQVLATSGRGSKSYRGGEPSI